MGSLSFKSSLDDVLRERKGQEAGERNIDGASQLIPTGDQPQAFGGQDDASDQPSHLPDPDSLLKH